MKKFESLYSVTDLFNDLPFAEKPKDAILIEKLDLQIDFSDVDLAISQAKGKDLKPDKMDALVGPALHYCLREAPMHILLNNGLWSWLALVRFRDFSDRRTDKVEDTQKWLGSSTFRDQNRHMLRRIFNLCDILVSRTALKGTYPNENRSYAECRLVLRNQDAVLQIGDSIISLNKEFIRQQVPSIIKIIKSDKDIKLRLGAHFKRLRALSTTRLTTYLENNDLATL